MQTGLLAIRSGGGGGEVALKASRDGDLRVAQYLPKYAMLAAAGKLFAVDMSGGTATAPSTSAVTTTVEWTIYNANDTRHLVLCHVGVNLESGTAGLGMSIQAASAIGPQTVVNTNYSGAVISCLDGSQDKPNFYLDNGTTIVGGTPTWQVIMAWDQLASNGVGNGRAVTLDGYITAPPGGSLCLQAIGETGATALWDFSMIVAEVEMD